MTLGTGQTRIYYNLYRFGADEDAVGRLINGDLPSDDHERWQMLDAPRYHIRRLLNEHLRAQAALRTVATPASLSFFSCVTSPPNTMTIG